MMNFTFNFFCPVITIVFTTVWAATGFNHSNQSASLNATVPPPSGHRTRRVRRPNPPNGGPRRVGRLRREKYVVPEKPIVSMRRNSPREGAIADLRQPTRSHRALKREDSFVLVDHGDHFEMVKPAYAKLYCHSVPEDIRTVAPFHALGGSVVGQELRRRLLAVSMDPPMRGRERVRFKEEEVDADDLRRPRKRLRSA